MTAGALRTVPLAGELTASLIIRDSGHLAAAEKRFAACLRASATGGDATLGASTMAFWANLRYSAGAPYGDLGLIERALGQQRAVASGRVLAMFHVRQARAHSKANEPTTAYRAIDAAFAAYDRAGPAAHDLPSICWMTHGVMRSVNLFQRGSVSGLPYCLAA